MPDVVVLSPHLDDAVLSVGALIARMTAAGRDVEVWTANTAGPPLADLPEDRRVFGDYGARRDEDARALALVGARWRWLDLVERIWRAPALPRTLDVFETPPTLDGFGQLARLRAIVGELFDTPGVTVYAPLGVGHHHDHVELTCAVVLELVARDAFDRVRFYEDVYALGAGCRRRHFVTRQRPWRALGAPAWASPRLGALLRLVDRAARGPGVDRLVPEAAALRWISVPEPAGEHERTKLAAVACYASQVREFGGMIHAGPFLHRGHDILGGEPIWFVRPSRG